MAGMINKIVAIVVILLLTVIMGVYTGVKNSSDYQITQFNFDEISNNVYVYRDSHFVPTIVASNRYDLFFAQGYEMARDRLWQLEFYRSVSNGEVSKLFGDSQITADMYLKILSMHVAAENTLKKLDQKYVDIIQAFIDGINKYIEFHMNNLPAEFTLLGVKPKQWTILDVIAMQGVLSRTLSISGMNREFERNKLAVEFGPAKAVEMYPIQSPEAEAYYLGLNQSTLAPIKNFNLSVSQILNMYKLDVMAGSNNWIVGPEKSATGNPLIANDPHLDLTTPSIWWQCQLIAPDFHVQGFSLPGVPGVITGHNKDVSWGVTNTGLDAVDVYYFKTNDKGQYYYNNTWQNFDTLTYKLGNNGKDYTVRYTAYGPVLDAKVFSGVPSNVDHYVYVLRWTYLENYDRDIIVKSVLDMDMATNQADIINALAYFAVPGQNFVYATVDGDFGYQFTGIIPIRKVPGSGVIPQNGSDSRFGWNGTVPYDQQYRVENPLDGFFATANQKVDTRDAFYISDDFALPYRSDRIIHLLNETNSVTITDMKKFQDDTYNLYAKTVLDQVMSEIKSTHYTGSNGKRFDDALNELTKWNYKMDRTSVGATVFAIFRIFLEKDTFKDDFSGLDTIYYENYSGHADNGITNIINDSNNHWFDDISTTSVTETRADIVHRAFSQTVDYLVANVSRLRSNWAWGKVHNVVFKHAFGNELFGVFNEGNVGSDGSEHTLKAAGDTPKYQADGSISLTQSHGSSYRYVAEVEPTWAQVWAIAPPGQSEHFFVGQRGNTINDWINGVTYHLSFSKPENKDPSFTFVKA